MKVNPKICVVCKQPFLPDPRVGDRQKVCKRLECQQQRKKMAQARWLRKNPDYFKGRYPQLKEQILQNQRSRTRTAVPHTVIIQDELTYCFNKLLLMLHKTQTIQDELTSRLSFTKLYLLDRSSLLYKTS